MTLVLEKDRQLCREGRSTFQITWAGYPTASKLGRGNPPLELVEGEIFHAETCPSQSLFYFVSTHLTGLLETWTFQVRVQEFASSRSLRPESTGSS